jgi:type II secretory pathway component PulJ
MIFRNIRLFNRKENGLTLIEIIVSLAITGFIGLGAAMSSAQVLNVTSKNNDFTAASRNAMNAIFWIGRDAQMAQVISGSAGFPGTADLSLAWEDWNNSSYNVTYSLENGRLLRTYTVDSQSTESLVAEYINSSSNMTYCTSDNGTLVLTITSSVGEGSKIINVTRVREMTARPQL